MMLMARPSVKRSIQPGDAESVSPSKEESGSKAGGSTRRGVTGGVGTDLGTCFSLAAGVATFGSRT